ncbi:MAG: orotidine-5'-phosphate decarboxylase [Actinobacteria bacterium]|nr:orotidine-5'-phosphate decarboxylase [Actinomycetota bacterium]
MKLTRDSLIVALDTDATTALKIASSLQGEVRWVKIGMTLYYSAGPAIVKKLLEMGFEIFLDLKLYDIPHQVEGAAREISRLGVSMITVHASGGAEMMRLAVKGAAEGAQACGLNPPKVLAVSVLTSFSADALRETGVDRSIAEQVALLVDLAAAAGVDGVVCSPHEATLARAALPSGAWVVTPGVRAAASSPDDQVRVATVEEALSAGASHVVIGRPITQADDVRFAVRHLYQGE